MNHIDFYINDLCKNSTELAAIIKDNFFPIGDIPERDVLQPYMVWGSTRNLEYAKGRLQRAYVGEVVLNLYGSDLKQLNDLSVVLEDLFHGQEGSLVVETTTINLNDLAFEGVEIPECDDDQLLFVVTCNLRYALQLVTA